MHQSYLVDKSIADGRGAITACGKSFVADEGELYHSEVTPFVRLVTCGECNDVIGGVAEANIV